jgi:4-hydroxybenzoyl-CoA reductase subunit alpha
MGQALCEETQYHEGLHMRANMLDYRVPTIVESPPIETFIVEAHDPNGPFGAKEAGEGSLSGFLPALTNAIADAIGLRLTELPASPDRIVDALTARRRAQRLAQASSTRATLSEEA